MSSESVEIVKTGYAAMDRGDLDGMLGTWAPDVVVHDPSRPDPTTSDGDWHGHEGARRYIGDWEDSFEESRAEPTELADAGEGVLVKVRTRARGRGSGVELANERFHVHTLRAGLVTRFAVYADEAEARAEAGLPS